MSSTLYTLMVIIGPIVLLAALAFAMMRNRTTRKQDADTATATRRVYHEQSQDDVERDR